MDCDKLADHVDASTTSVAAVFVHELTHWTFISKGAGFGGNHIDDLADSPYDCFKLSDEGKLLNAENYALMATVSEELVPPVTRILFVIQKLTLPVLSVFVC